MAPEPTPGQGGAHPARPHTGHTQPDPEQAGHGLAGHDHAGHAHAAHDHAGHEHAGHAHADHGHADHSHAGGARSGDGRKRSRFPGSGLAKGLAVTLRTMTRRTVTEQYPDAQPELAPRTRGVIGLFEENCTVCMLCARECPDWCIYIDSHKETVPAATPGGRDRSRNVLDRFAIDFALCMYCGICIEVCPFDALFWSPEFEYAETDIRDLTHERDKLREWMWTVPEPPALDPAAEEPKEIAAARRAADKLAVQRAVEDATEARLGADQQAATDQATGQAPHQATGRPARPASGATPGQASGPGTTEPDGPRPPKPNSPEEEA